MKKYISVLFLVAFIIPLVTFASWWNPFSWKIFQKKSIAPQAQVEKQVTPEEKINELQKQIDELEKEKTDSTPIAIDTKALTKPTYESVSKRQTVSQKSVTTQNGSVSSKNVVEVLDSMTNNTQPQLLRIGDYSKNIDYYIDWATRGKNAVKPLLDMETDPYLRTEWKYIYDLFNYVSKVTDGLKDGSDKTDDQYSVQSLLESVNDHVVYLQKEKASVPEYYENQDAEMEALKKLIDINIKYQKNMLDRTHFGHQMLFKAVETAMDKINETEPIIDAYLLKQKPNNTVVNNTKTIYKTIAVPQIQIPQTTYCTMGPMAGAKSYYRITCN